MREMNIPLLIVGLVLVGGLFWWFASDNGTDPNGDGIVDTSDWVTYTNEEFDFTLQHPPEWQVHEDSDAQITPIFNFYKGENGTTNPPFTHHNADITHVSVFPQGVPTEGVFGESEESGVSFEESVQEARDYTLSGGSVWATYVNFSNPPESWNESGFMFANTVIEDHETECRSNGEVIPEEQCEPLGEGHTIVHSGSIDENDRRVQEEILSSFSFIENGNGGNGGNGGAGANGDQTNGSTYNDLVQVSEPQENEVVNSPLTISGEARGQWYFEATFPFRLEDAEGNVLAESFAAAEDEWMTTEYVPFTGEITFDAPDSSTGMLIIERSNPSGLPENADEFSIPVRFQ